MSKYTAEQKAAIMAEARANIERADNMLGFDRETPVSTAVVTPSENRPPIESRSARWKREAAEREAARQAEDERRRQEWAEEIRQRQAAADRVEAEVAHDLTFALAKEVAAALDVERHKLADAIERIDKLEATISELKTKRSRAAKAAAVINLPSRAVS